MTPEQKFWQLLKPHVPGHVDRIENSASVGIPDVCYCYRGLTTWLELKAKPIRGEVGTIIETPSCIRVSQVIWHDQRKFHGGRVLVATRFEDTIVLLTKFHMPGRYKVNLVQTTKPWDWEAFESVLKGNNE